MNSFGNERQVQQGEDWNLDILLSASDREYIPFIVSSQRNNPFFVVTIASTKFEKNLRYVKSFWNNVDSINPIDNLPYIPRFFDTVPVYCGELKEGDELPTVPGEGTFAEFTIGDNKNTRYLYQYVIEGEEIDKSVGHQPYYYFYFEYGDTTERIDDYECRVRFNFPSEITAEWTSQNYLYQITLVSGILMADKLNQIFLDKENKGEIKADEWPTDITMQYKYVKTVCPNELQPDIDVDSPLGKILSPEPILPPTKLEVFNNLRTLI